MLGIYLILLFLAVTVTFHRARINGRRGTLRAVVGLMLFICTALLVGSGVAALVFVVYDALGWGRESYGEIAVAIELLAIVSGMAAIWALLKGLDRPGSPPLMPEPPPPPAF